jgi:guanosine-3',5'-bis(diphosphate) 3'-pyrophosphohydrolase
MLFSLKLERALRWAAERHHGQSRKGSSAPYLTHLVGVAMILDRLGFPEPVLIAGLLHDVTEDTDSTLGDLRDQFGADVAEIVRHCSEKKIDDQGRKRAWIDRKTDHLRALHDAPPEARAVFLADKLHNLTSIACDLNEGRDVWSLFNAERERVLWYYRAAVQQFGSGLPELERLGDECRRVLAEVESTSVKGV